MLKILMIVAIVIAALIASVLIAAATRPDVFRVERTQHIDAPPEEIFPLIADFHAWEEWSPFEKADPAMKKTYSGATSGAGAVYEWEGNSQAGAGRIELIEVKSPSQVTMTLDMIKPCTATNTVVFSIDKSSTGAAVTWAMEGKQPFMGKVMGLFINMDKMVGSQFEEGLTKLKTIAES